MMDNRGFDGNDSKAEASICVGKFDFNTSSTIELTGNVSELKKNGYEIKPEEQSTKAHKTTSDFGALLHVVKSSLGTGVLASASGFKNAGVTVGIIGTVLIGYLCAHCTAIMVRCSQEMCSLLKVSTLGYGEAIEASMNNCNNTTVKKFAPISKKFADLLMFFTYFGVNTVYIILVAETFKQILESHVEVTWNIRIYIIMTAIPVYLVGMIKDMKYLVPFSAFANTCLLLSLCMVMYFVLQDLPPISSRPMHVSITRLPSFIATVMFGMEGIGTMLPIENSMKHRKHFLGCPGVLNFAMVIVVGLFLFVGLLGYIKFGDASKGSITLNLSDDIFAEVIKGLVGLAILFSYGLQLTAAMDVIWRGVESRFTKVRQTQAYYLIRAVLILCTVIVAILVPNLGPVISLIGAVGFASCGFLFPALADIAISINRGFGRLNWILWKNLILIIVAIFAIVLGGIVSVEDIIAEYQ